MYYMAFGIEHDVAVVSIFDLKEKTDDAVCRHRYYEITSRRLELERIFIAVRLQEILVHSDVGLTAELIARLRVRNTFYNSTLKQTGF